MTFMSNAKIMTDDNLELTVSITRSKNGGVYRKLRDLVHNNVIRKNKMNLFCPSNIQTVFRDLSRPLSEP